MLAAFRKVHLDVKAVLSGDSGDLEMLANKHKAVERLRKAAHTFQTSATGARLKLKETARLSSLFTRAFAVVIRYTSSNAAFV